ncbi:hypothetical protein ACFHW2_40185 [Actinomadura sp. LOL_016]|uniref:hypothetical protein n=1 Tax=unclassified Actinomadura TaxID=2626254 RepID=UPI003A80BCDA
MPTSTRPATSRLGDRDCGQFLGVLVDFADQGLQQPPPDVRGRPARWYAAARADRTASSAFAGPSSRKTRSPGEIELYIGIDSPSRISHRG